ncbi:acetylglutamate kinase [Segniliparus rotundus DSM 44985]|uniref:Acetylglutamate kinase n=1 Tax=Segniliparus rotundus (strain ATCC BAA-972 / CDC 1076 / CIP 108378 / DSM 44985 / JCM 13578) TaxID=640132 RepID=D6ZET0_SEGRD|nr:acetylglutamate kinase [Segniliparus rotundus]ADG97454.1 acetylglutamate kinase [Segniliparus rotundus DSM 44985]
MSTTALQQAEVLAQALPWIEKLSGKTVVVKFGGNAMVDPALATTFAEDMVLLRACGVRPVVVHGGGPQINEQLAKLGIEGEFKAGLRVTTPEVLEVVRMVLLGQVGRELVGAINAHGPYAVGTSGEDARLFTASRKTARVDGLEVDIGLVGDIEAVDAGWIDELTASRRIPVVASLAPDATGVVHNVNADIAAGALAGALKADRLIVLSDVAGLYTRWPEQDSFVSEISLADAKALLPSLAGGMIPKLEACVRAVGSGVRAASIIDGRVPHATLVELFTPTGVGTMITDTTAPSAGERT